MGDPAEVAQKIDPHLRDLAVVDAVLATASRPEVDRKIFPSQMRLLLQREGETDILKFEIRWNLAQRFPQRLSPHQPIRHVRVGQVSAGH